MFDIKFDKHYETAIISRRNEIQFLISFDLFGLNQNCSSNTTTKFEILK
jgi:hypothetical protein